MSRFSRPTRQEYALALYVGVVAASAVAVAIALVETGTHPGNPWAVAGLVLFAATAERGQVRLGKRVTVSISLFPALFAAVVFGPLAAMIVFGASMFMRLDVPLTGRAVFAASRSLTGAAAAVAAALAGGLAHSDVGQVVVATAVGGVVAELLDVVFAAVTFRLRGHGEAREAVTTLLPVVLASVPFYTPVVGVLGLAYRELSPWTMALFFVPAIAAQRWFVLYQEERRLAEDLAVVNQRLESASLSFATALVATLDARDRYTAGHSAAVAVYARDIASRMGLAEEEQRLAHLAGLVHDIGKIGLPAGLLEKAGALTLDERRQMETHSTIGERIIAKVDTYAEVAAIVRHHHERIDGLGYPDGLQRESIPLLARIIAVADAYNAMTSDRPYRDAMPSRVARLRLAQAVDSQFDTAVVAAFEAVLASASEEYRLGQELDFKFSVEKETGESMFDFAQHPIAVAMADP